MLKKKLLSIILMFSVLFGTSLTLMQPASAAGEIKANTINASDSATLAIKNDGSLWQLGGYNPTGMPR